MTVRTLATAGLVGLVALFDPRPLAGQRIKLPAKLSELEARARADSNDAAAHHNVALAYWNEKRWDDAERALRAALALDPKFAQAYLALARLPFGRRPQLWEDMHERRVPEPWKQPLEDAFRQYRRAFLVDPLVDLRIEGVVRPGKSSYWIQSETHEAVYRYLFQGFDELQDGRYDAAFNSFTRLIDDTRPAALREALPGFIWYYHGLAAAHIGRFDEAMRDFARLLERAEKRQSPDSLVFYIPIELNEYRYMLGLLHQRAGQPEEAIRRYRQAIENDIGFYMAHARMAEIYENAQQWDRAIESRRHAINANPDDPSLLLDLGVTLGKAGRLDDAEGTLRQGMEANPRDPRPPYYLGVVCQQLKKSEDAKAAFTRFLSLAPSRYDRQIQDAKQRLAALP